MSLEQAALQADRAVLSALKERDKIVAEVVQERLGITVPAVFTFTDPETGNQYAVNVTARLSLIERGVPAWAEDAKLTEDE